MKNFVYMILICLLLAACSQTTEPSAVATSSSNAAPADNAVGGATTEEENTAVSAITPATTIAEASSIRPQDWVKGASDPKVVIIEYGDFQ